MGIQSDIKAAIDKNLPKEVGERLAERLAEADRLEKENKKLDKEVKRLTVTVADLEGRALDTKEIKEQRSAIAIDRKRLSDDRTELDHQERLMQIQLDCEEKRREDVMAIIGGILGNRLIRTNIQTQIPVAEGERTEQSYNNGNQVITKVDGGQRLEDVTTKTEVEET